MIKISKIPQILKFQKMKRLAVQIKKNSKKTDVLRDMLIVFPENPELFKIAFSQIILLLNQTGQTFLLVVNEENYGLVSERINKADCILLTETKRNNAGIYPEVATMLAGGRFHYFVDLNPGICNWRVFLVQCISADKKIGFQEKGLEQLYNIHIQYSNDQYFESKYQQIREVLS